MNSNTETSRTDDEQGEFADKNGAECLLRLTGTGPGYPSLDALARALGLTPVSRSDGGRLMPRRTRPRRRCAGCHRVRTMIRSVCWACCTRRRETAIPTATTHRNEWSTS